MSKLIREVGPNLLQVTVSRSLGKSDPGTSAAECSEKLNPSGLQLALA
jgi:hypothetical protein